MGDDDGLRCPRCNSAVSTVRRTMKIGKTVRRYRECFHCAKNFVTSEYAHAPKKEKKPDIRRVKDDGDDDEDGVFYFLD